MNGIFYIASGERYVAEAVTAIAQTKAFMPKISIAMCSNLTQAASIPGVDIFLEMQNPQFNFADKVNNFMRTPFERTIFLDTDTWLVDPIYPLFEILDCFDIAAPHAPIEEDELVVLPDAFAEMNSGVIAYRKNHQVSRLMELYRSHFQNSLHHYKLMDGIPPDQPSFRYAVYHSEARFLFLPHEYNCMLDYPCFLSSRVHILHGRRSIADLQMLEREINAECGCRVYTPRHRQTKMK